MKFAKPATTFDTQIDLMIERGMVVADRDQARHYLAHVNYYRLAGYILPFETDHATHRLRPGTRFEDVLDLYVFDRELRLLLLDALERIETSARTQWAYHFSHAATPHSYLDCRHAGSRKLFARQLGQLESEIERSKETFITHHKSKYTDPDLPPAWVACEVMSFGQLSQWYTNLRPLSIRKQIASTYGLDQQVLQSALQHLTYVRNICAHHARLWNREFVITWSMPRKGDHRLQEALCQGSARRLYNTLCLMTYVMDCISPNHSWQSRLVSLIDTHGVDAVAMGAPADWRGRSLWEATSGPR